MYNRRLMACCFDHRSTIDGYWLLRQKVAVLNTGELPLQFKGTDAERLLEITNELAQLRGEKNRLEEEWLQVTVLLEG